MRTTVTIDPDVEALLAKQMKTKGLSFKEALNSAVRAGLLAGTAARAPAPVKLRAFSMGRARVNLDKALSIAAAMEDDELIRKLELNK